MVTVLSFSRAVQRLIEQTWELDPLSVRNTFNGLLWIGGLALYTAITGILHVALGRSDVDLAAALLGLPLSAVFLIWSAWVLSAKRIERHELVPFGIVGAALLSLYSVGATVYVPHLFSTYATRYGVIGAVFAIISALFCVMVVVVGSAAAGRESAMSSTAYAGANGPPKTRSGTSGIRSSAKRGLDGTRCGRRSMSGGTGAAETELAGRRWRRLPRLTGGPPL